VGIEASKDGIRFSCQGDIGSGSVTVRQHSNVEKPENDVTINLSEPVSLTFSLKYLVNFCKASGLSSKVKLCLSQEVPLLVEYQLTGTGYLRFYLAPKVWHLYSCCQATLRIASCTDSYFLRRSEMMSDVASRLTFRVSSIS
jgi:proliferating cell nuclear antigen PCNA